MTDSAAPPRFFVTGTDTGVGKTEVSCALLSLLVKSGHSPVPFKPYESGCGRGLIPADALALRAAARCDEPLERISIHRFESAVAPGVAAAREGRSPSWGKTLKAFRALDGRAVVVEGAGGLLVPLDKTHDVIDLIAALKLPVVLVARAELGTLNHVGLSLEVLERRRMTVQAVVLSQSTPRQDSSRSDNASVLRKRHPRIVFLGPVPYKVRESARRLAFQQMVKPLVST